MLGERPRRGTRSRAIATVGKGIGCCCAGWVRLLGALHF